MGMIARIDENKNFEDWPSTKISPLYGNTSLFKSALHMNELLYTNLQIEMKLPKTQLVKLMHKCLNYVHRVFTINYYTLGSDKS